MSIVEVWCSLPGLNHSHRSDLARRIAMAFRMCYRTSNSAPRDLDLSELQIVFVPIISQFDGSQFFETGRSITQKSSSSAPEQSATNDESNNQLGLLRVTMIVPADDQFGESGMREGLINRVGAELKTWLASLYMTEECLIGEDKTEQTTRLPRVIPVIEYRQMAYNCHSVNGKIKRLPYGAM